MSINRKRFIEEFIKIKTKDSRIIKLKFNVPQQMLYEKIKYQASQNLPVRIIVLKARQEGISTAVESIIFTNTITSSNVKSGIITHSDKATSNLYEMSKLMYAKMPEDFRPSLKYSNAKSLVFDNDSGTGLNSSITCMTARADGVGRSDTYHNLHISEYAFWPGDKHKTLAGLLASVPDLPKTMVIIESTPNGYDDFKELWDRAVNGKSGYLPLFIGWNCLPEYQRPYDGFKLTEEEIELKELYQLTNEQISWRRHKIKTDFSGDVDMFKQEYPICPEEAFIGSGACVFDKQQVINRIQRIKDRKPLKKGYFSYVLKDLSIKNIRWVDDPKGCVDIYQEPLEGYPYVLSGDTAGTGHDDFSGDVLNNITCEQVASLDLQTDEDLYTQQMYCLGHYYNYALVNIENNYSTYPTKMLWNYGYTNQYQRQVDNLINVKIQDKIGWMTTLTTRPVLISTLVEFVRNDIDKINNLKTLNQFLTFVKKPNGKKEAESGAHDDRVMSYGIGLMSREQQSFEIKKEETRMEISWPDPLKTDDDDDYEENEILRW